MRRRASILILSVVLASSSAGATKPVRVRIGGSDVEDACGSTGRVAVMRAGGYLAVRGGPGILYPARDRLFPGRTLAICEERGDWIGVIYGPDGLDCAVSSPIRQRRHYAGPCRSGWVHRRYVELVAG